MPQIYADVKASLAELNPEFDYKKFSISRGAHGPLKRPVYDDIPRKVKDYGGDITGSILENRSVDSKADKKSKTPRTASKQIMDFVGRGSVMVPESQEPDINFTTDPKAYDNILEKGRQASRKLEEQEETERQAEMTAQTRDQEN